ncbi:class I SAM-dependent methyltransferase [Alteromonas confluentis]|uniref:Methyltransferase type 11 n=1 Tax=Alteromonas confluentis TaxID=1656094 RepID=A0A1E7ZDA2_9ALTE|nr:class I SAM-dependent methyltransferase [Alteromonas confluentis]OFC71451.1 methyltransferase type 11 [Alteromonas confluentis]
MTPEQTGLAYDQITHLWTRDDFNRKNGVAQHRKAIAFAKNKHNALDVGCGCTGRFIDLLLEEGFAVSGIDISANMVALARLRHPHLDFYHTDILSFSSSSRFDFITAWDSIWHVPLREQGTVLAKIVSLLKPGGIFIFTFGGTDEEGEHCNNAMGPQVCYSTLGTNGFIDCLMALGCKIKHLESDQMPELHTYLIVEKI